MSRRSTACGTTLLVWLLAGMADAHTKPRALPQAKPITQSDFRCPSGAYLQSDRPGPDKDRTPKLQRHMRRALARSLVPSTLDAPVRGIEGISLFYTHESAAWPKPARCQLRRQAVCRFNPHFCLLLPQGNSPRNTLVSEHHGIEFRQVWKVASSSLASFFFCNMWGHLRSEKLLPGQPPPKRKPPASVDAAPPMRVVFPAREPISRFVAASIEVLERLLNRVSPSGQRMPDEMYREPNGPFSPSVLAATTSWYAPLQAILRASNASVGQGGAAGRGNGALGTCTGTRHSLADAEGRVACATLGATSRRSIERSVPS